jgi:hypothetical protein
MLKPTGGYFVNTPAFANWGKMFLEVFFLEKHRLEWIFRISLKIFTPKFVIIAGGGGQATNPEN